MTCGAGLRPLAQPRTAPSTGSATAGGTLALPPPHLLQARGLILQVLGQQDEHAEVLVLKRELYDLAVDAVDVAHAERGFQAHHLHWLGVRL